MVNTWLTTILSSDMTHIQFQLFFSSFNTFILLFVFAKHVSIFVDHLHEKLLKTPKDKMQLKS